ncbi:MAG: tRNA 2-thiouridine(34) synthase MnmA [Actinobacteria bacterium]|nr:tRNA 2-thiouridine(34) synthase MnmA [Actinomycetota bacterium]
MATKAVVAMSGGVDSSVAAALLVQGGFDVTGVMLKLWRGEAENNASGCCNVGAADDARRVADVLGIPFYVLNFAERFEDSVVDDFRRTYAAGRTPNPCVRCNQWIKFDALLERTCALGAEVLATGHYARVARAGEGFRLLRGVDRAKDQSYVLWMLGQEALSRCMFPIGDLDKTETRRIATELGLRTASKPDSQEICFVRNGDLPRYIAQEVPEASIEGPIVDRSGRELGRHQGIGRYTVGQRKGIGISLGRPIYVSSIDARSNSVTIGERAELGVDALVLEETSAVAEELLPGEEVLLQHRAHGEVHAAEIASSGRGRLEIAFRQPAEAIAPGQSAALYSSSKTEELRGGGIIASVVQSATPAAAR